MLPAANALNATVMKIGSIAGPLLAGALIPVLGISVLYLIDTFALARAVVAVCRLPAIPPLAGCAGGPGYARSLAGFRYLAMHRCCWCRSWRTSSRWSSGCRGRCSRSWRPDLRRPASGLALGVLFAAIPAGSLVGGLALRHFSRVRRPRRRGRVRRSAAWGVGVAGFGLSRYLWVAAPSWPLAGAADLVSMVFRSSILQEAATDEMRGRMQGVFTVVVAGGPGWPTCCTGWSGPPSAPR